MDKDTSHTAAWAAIVAGDGMEQKVDDKTLFCTPDPLAASTVTRDPNRAQVTGIPDTRGSFLDDLSRLSLQSVSAMDLTNQFRQLNFTSASDNSPRDKITPADEGPDLIQFSGATDVGVGDQETSDSLTDVSPRSSMGLIPADMLNALSASVLPMATPKTETAPEVQSRKLDFSHSVFKEKTADSNDWSDNSKMDSKQDSKDLPWGRSHLETVKKRPQSMEGEEKQEQQQGAVKRLAARGAVSLFGGHLLDNVEEGEELDQSVYNVELGDEDLKQLDADVDFSDLEEDNMSLEEGRESGDEDFDFDEPMLSLPTRGRVERRLEDEEAEREEARDAMTLHAELAEAEGRLGEGQESDEDANARQPVRSSTDSGLDSRYFRKTHMEFAGDGVDTEVASSRSSLTANSQQRGAAEGEHLLTKLRRQLMSGDGSENEIDTDDELEAARKSMAMAARERGQGADDAEGTERHNLPQPVGLEDEKASDSDGSSSRHSQLRSQLFSTRQSAEGDTAPAYSPVAWSGGGGGDGSSGGDSDDKDRKADSRPPYRYVSGAAENPDIPPSSNVSVMSTPSKGAKDESGLPSIFFMPSSMLHDSNMSCPPTRDGSTFNVEDVLKFRAENSSAAFKSKQRDNEQCESRAFTPASDPENPFEDQFVGSFGSFGMGSNHEGMEDTGDERIPDIGTDNVSTCSKKDECPAVYARKPVSASASFEALPSTGSGSFDGPFRKPRAPPPSKKKTEKVERESNLEKELRELGIVVGDDDFFTSESAQAMLDADEKQFEEENKFNEHHHLALAAEGLAWEEDESRFSGYLGGEEKPEHLETSIGTYMAARTETLGTLGGDPFTQRPDFGKPVESPPHRTRPVKLMSPPSTASSVLLDSRTEGEGDEDGDTTLVNNDSTLHATPIKSSDCQPVPDGKQLSVSVTDDGGTAKVAAENRGSAEMTLREELSSLLLDLTNAGGGGDLSMEDALSMSSVFDFIKNHSYTNSSDFASAILKLSQNKKRQQKKATGEKLVTLTEEGEGQGEGRSKVVSLVSDQEVRTSSEKSSSSCSAHSSPGQAASNTSSAGSPSSITPRLKGSKLPVRVKDSLSAKEHKQEKTCLCDSLPQGGGRSPSKKQAEFQSQHQNPASSVKGDQLDANRLISDQQGTGQRHSHWSESSVSRSGSNRARVQSSSEDMARKQSNEDRNNLSQDQVRSGQAMDVIKSANKSSGGFHQSRDRQVCPDLMQQKRSSVIKELKKENEKLKSVPSSSSKYDNAMNIRATEQSHRAEGTERGSTSRSSSEDRHHGEMLPQQFMLQTPPQRLPAADQHCTASIDSFTQNTIPQQLPDRFPPENTLPQNINSDGHSPDGMEDAVSAEHSHEVTRQQAVGMENEDLKESESFDLVRARCDGFRQQATPHPWAAATPAQRLEPSSQTRAAESVSSTRPTLLTGGSLLKTEFAQKFLNPNQPTAADLSVQGADRCVDSQSSTRIPPDHLRPWKDGDLTLNIPLDGRATQPGASRPSVSQPAHPNSEQRVQRPNHTLQPLDESAASMYYELNEDLQQSTMLAGERSALGSFWGKSPLYQSTPAFEVGKVAAVSMMASRLDERELTTPSTNLVTPRVQRQLIEIQRSSDFPEFCCLGVSQKMLIPVTNRTAFSVACRFRLVQLLHNGKLTKVDQHSPFELKPKLSISAGACETLPVLFVPKRPGEHVCQVEVLSQSLNPGLEHTSNLIQLKAVAEVPHIQISPSVDMLHVGEVMWGGNISKTIKLRNMKRASLPVRLSLWSGSSVWHCFTFESSENCSDVSIISMSNRPESLGRNVTTVNLPGCDSPDMAKTVEITVFCRPPKKEYNRALAERPADKIEAKIDIEVDTPVQYLPPLASLLLQATVGIPRLLIPPSHMSLTFKAEPNKNIQESIVVNNAGNITMDLALSVTTFPECFRISPTHVSIKPGDREEVSVIFSPLEDELLRYQSLLLMDIEPEGPSYEIPMEARVNQPASQPVPLSILTNKSYLSFNGVSLNHNKSLTVRLYNKDSLKTEHACVEIRQSSDCFKLVSSSGEWQQKCDVVIEPKEKVSLTVVFCPTAVRGYSAKMVIRKRDAHPSKYSIPLSGYGGGSMLALSGACQTNSGQRWLELGALSAGHNIMREVVLTNSGVRAAFVRATTFFDMPCRQAVPPGRVAVEPNNFVLAAGCSMKVMVAISPSQREVDLVRDRKEVVAVVRFQHGDEVMRQKYQRACGREGSVDSHSWQAAFRQQFANEVQDAVTVEGRTIPDSPNDSSAFFHHMSAQCVALLAEPHPGPGNTSLSVSSVLQSAAAPPTSSAKLERTSVPTRDNTLLSHREGSLRHDSSSHQFQIPSRPERDEGDWTVKPDFLSLTVGENNQKILQLINFSRHPLRFELSRPPSTVVPEPQKGELKPRSSTSVEVWLHMAWQKRLSELPWRGAITISCNGQEKIVKVSVQKPLVPVPSASLSPVSVSSTLSRSPRDTASNQTPHSLQLASTNIHFSKAKINGLHESVIELTNVSMDPMHWSMSAFAPAYVKGADDSNTIQRVGYTVFTVSPTSADLLPQETMKVPVKFCPQTKGTFNQHWEIEYQPLTASTVTTVAKRTTRVSLTALVSGEENLGPKKPTWDPVDQGKPNVASTRTPLQEKHPNTANTGKSEPATVSAPDLQLIHPDVTFSNTKVGHLTQVKVEFKNSLDHNVELEVVPPKAPFRIKHKNFKITRKRFLKYPIEFGPTAAGTFADSVVFRAPSLGKTFTVFLRGTAL